MILFPVPSYLGRSRIHLEGFGVAKHLQGCCDSLESPLRDYLTSLAE